MKINKLYLLEIVYHDGEDQDGEPIEDRWIVGYFTDLALLQSAKRECNKNGIEEDNYVVTEFSFDGEHHQRYAYVLNYEYSLEIDGQYEDYYYFEPKPNRRQCLQLKKQLLSDPKYRPYPNKLYTNSKDGFFIEKIKINFYLPDVFNFNQ